MIANQQEDRMSKGKIALVIAGGAINGALGACILIWPANGAILASVIGVVTMLVAGLTGVSLGEKKEY